MQADSPQTSVRGYINQAYLCKLNFIRLQSSLRSYSQASALGGFPDLKQLARDFIRRVFLMLILNQQVPQLLITLLKLIAL